jgi:hypothetical protein
MPADDKVAASKEIYAEVKIKTGNDPVSQGETSDSGAEG